MSHCDLRTGLCGDLNQPDQERFSLNAEPAATILVATDPICSHCWAMEPAWRRLLYHYGRHLDVRHLYGGLLPGWEGFADAGAGIRQPADVAPHWAEVAQHHGQPIDPSVWLTDPLSSSYPPSIAVHLVRLMDPAREEAFLRRIRQAVFLEARNIARADILAACAADVGLDAQAFATRFEAGEGKAGFQQDLQEVRRLPVAGFPTVIMMDKAGQGLVLRGGQPFRRLEDALLQVTGLPRVEGKPSAAEALAAYGTGTTREFAELLELEPAQAADALRAAGGSAQAIAGDLLWSAV